MKALEESEEGVNESNKHNLDYFDQAELDKDINIIERNEELAVNFHQKVTEKYMACYKLDGIVEKCCNRKKAPRLTFNYVSPFDGEKQLRESGLINKLTGKEAFENKNAINKHNKIQLWKDLRKMNNSRHMAKKEKTIKINATAYQGRLICQEASNQKKKGLFDLYKRITNSEAAKIK